MAFNKEEYTRYLVDSGRVNKGSSSTYASNLLKVAKVLGVDVEKEYEKDECKSLEERRLAWCEEHKREQGWGSVADGKAALDAYVAYKTSLKIAVRYWIYSPGYVTDDKWEEFYNNNIMAIARENIGDLGQYKTREEITKALQANKKPDSGQTTSQNASLEAWQFVHELKKGDIVFVKRGRDKILGKGIVLSDYIYDEKRADVYKNIRKMNWLHKGEWEHPEGNAVTKILTDITNYSSYIQKLNAIFEKEDGQPTEKDSLQDKYTIEEICDILKIFLARRKASGEKTAAQNYFYAVYGKYLRNYKNGDEDWERILKTMGTDSRGPFSWITSLCSYLEGNSLSLGDFYKKAQENCDYINNNSREENIQYLQFALDETLSQSPTIAGGMYFGFYNALNIQANKITINKFKEVEIEEIASDTVVNAIRAGSRLYHFIAKNEDLLTEIAPSNIEAIIKTLPIKNQVTDQVENDGGGTGIDSFTPQTLVSGKKHNIILFGAPGTGKSHKLQKDSEEFGGRCERVTFHPDYTYAHFVGTYKPVVIKNEETGKNEIEYNFVAGPFLRVYLAAKTSSKPVLLIIEEINRANVAAVFGDVFQLLDRDENGKSEYEVAVSEDVKKWLSDNGINETELSLPENMYIWATMNSADQGVFPMDTAFKRRWEFEYTDLYPALSWRESLKPQHWDDWEMFRKNVNNALLDAGINEDKCMGPFFISPKSLDKWIDAPDFRKMFASKVLMYLFEDAAKQKRSKIFNTDRYKSFSGICKDFCEGKKEEIFAKDFFNGDGE